MSQAQEKLNFLLSTNNKDNDLESKISTYKDALTKLKQEIEELKKSIDDKVNDIKTLDGSITIYDIIASGEAKEEGTEDVDYGVQTIATDITGKTKVDTDCGSQEKGYSRIIYTSNGKVIKVFQQAWNENLKYASGGGLRTKGCGYNALASILTAVDQDITPEEVFEMGSGSDLYANDVKKIVENNYGIPVGYRLKNSMERSNYYEKIATELSKGNMVICTVDAGPDAKYTRNGHWVSLVDYDSTTKPIDLTVFLKNYEVNSNIVYLNDTSGYSEDCKISGKPNDTMLSKITIPS